MASPDGLEVGATAPDFEASLVTPGGDVNPVRFSDLLEDAAVLLNFYTVDFSPDCVDEWCDFRDFGWFDANEQVRVVVVSKSGPQLHRRFMQYLDIPFPLYSDTNLAISEAFEVDYRAFGVFHRSRRSTFLVDQDRETRYKWLAEHWLDPTRDTPPMEEIYEAVQRELGEEPPDAGF